LHLVINNEQLRNFGALSPTGPGRRDWAKLNGLIILLEEGERWPLAAQVP